MSKKIIEKINELHNQNKHQKIIEIIYSINENERDYEIILLFARALNNVQNYDEALDNLMYIREEGLFDPLWYYRTGYAYYHKNEKNTAKQYFSKAIELFENYDKKNIENFSEISNNIKNLYSLCFENEDKELSFAQRVKLFWKWFEENETEIDDIIKNKNKDIIHFLSHGVKIISDNLAFNIGRNYNFTFNIVVKIIYFISPQE